MRQQPIGDDCGASPVTAPNRGGEACGEGLSEEKGRERRRMVGRMACLVGVSHRREVASGEEDTGWQGHEDSAMEGRSRIGLTRLGSDDGSPTAAEHRGGEEGAPANSGERGIGCEGCALGEGYRLCGTVVRDEYWRWFGRLLVMG